jgi:hypothetical protein
MLMMKDDEFTSAAEEWDDDLQYFFLSKHFLPI